jgi:hypothetical protein
MEMEMTIDFLFLKYGLIFLNYKIKGKKMLEKIKQVLSSKVSILIYGILIGTIMLFLINTSVKEKNESEIKRTKLFEQIEYFYQTWLDYQELKGINHHSLWNKKFHDIEYRLDGNPKNNEHDCSSAIYWYLTELKANFSFCKVQTLYERLNFMVSKRVNIKEVKAGDLIIIYVDSNWHIGLVEGKREKKNIVKYMDVNIAYDGAGYKQVTLNSSIVKGVFPVTFELWIGDLLRNVKKAKDLHIIIESEKIKEIKEVSTKEGV